MSRPDYYPGIYNKKEEGALINIINKHVTMNYGERATKQYGDFRYPLFNDTDPPIPKWLEPLQMKIYPDSN